MIEEKEEVQKAQTEEVDGLTYTIVKIPRTKKVYKVRTLTNNQLEDIARLLFRDGEQKTTEEPVPSTWKEQYLRGLKIGGICAGAILICAVPVILVIRRRKRHEA